MTQLTFWVNHPFTHLTPVLVTFCISMCCVSDREGEGETDRVTCYVKWWVNVWKRKRPLTDKRMAWKRDRGGFCSKFRINEPGSKFFLLMSFIAQRTGCSKCAKWKMSMIYPWRNSSKKAWLNQSLLCNIHIALGNVKVRNHSFVKWL